MPRSAKARPNDPQMAGAQNGVHHSLYGSKSDGRPAAWVRAAWEEVSDLCHPMAETPNIRSPLVLGGPAFTERKAAARSYDPVA